MHYTTHEMTDYPTIVKYFPRLKDYFWHSIRLKPLSPIAHRFPSHETEEPFRWSNSLILHLPLTPYGFVVGRWHTTDRTEEQMLIEAMQGRQMDDDEFTEAEKAHIRRNLIKKQFSAEQQELLVEVLDL